jgi:hypothetical protein
MLQKPAGVTEDGTEFECDRFEVILDPLSAGRLQRAEQPVALTLHCRIWLHDDVLN